MAYPENLKYTKEHEWISVDGGQHWAQYKGSNFPAVPVDDIAVQARESDLVLAAEIRPADHADSATMVDNVAAAQINLEAAGSAAESASQSGRCGKLFRISVTRCTTMSTQPP